jgi:hypothetical protein
MVTCIVYLIKGQNQCHMARDAILRAPHASRDQCTLQQSTIAKEYEYTRVAIRMISIGLNSLILALVAPPQP